MRNWMIALAAMACLGTLAAAQAPRRATTVRNGNWNDSPYGMNGFHPNGPSPQGHLVHFTDANIARLKEGEIRWVRLMVDWRYCEPQRGQYYWDAMERTVTRLNEAGIGISACLYEPPNWARVPNSDFLVDPAAFESFGEAIATRFRDRIAAYEIYNERPTGSWPKVAERSAAVYVPIQQAAYRGIKRGDPNAIVVMTGLWEFPQYYLEDMYKAGAKGSFDAVNVHYYLRGDRDPTRMDAFRGDLDLVLKQIDYVTRKYGDAGIPIWFTEYGWPATDESQAFPVGEEKMAEYMQYFLQHAMDSGLVEKAFWYVYYMPDGMALWHERENRKRPAWYTHRNFQRGYPTWNDRPIEPLPYPPAAGAAAEVPGADFEDLAAWQVGPGADVELRSGDAPHGERYLHMTCTQPEATVTGQTFALEPGRTYELTGWLRMSGGLADPRYAHAMIHLELLGEGNRPLDLLGPRKGEVADDRSTNYYIADTQGQWYEVHYFVFTTPETRAGRVLLRMGHPDAPRGEADFDHVQIRPVDLGAFDE